MMEEREKINEERRAVTHRLTRRALKLGFKIPREPGWWYENEDFYGGKTLEEIELSGLEYFLTDDGIAGAEGLISAKMGEIWDRRVRLTCQIVAVLTGILTAMIGLAGALIGLLVTLRK
jgi:hypothetical protein